MTQDQIMRLVDEYATLTADIPATTKARAAVVAAIDQLTKDAERYRVGREAALEEAATLCNGEQWVTSAKSKSVDYIKAFNEGCADCEAVIRRLK